MSTVPPAAPLAPKRFLPWPDLVAALAAILLAVWTYHPVEAVLDSTLDTSNYASYAAFTASGAQFGRDVMPMAGPYGFINYGFVYGGELFWTRLALEFLVKAAFGLLVCWFFRQSGGLFGRWLWLAAVVVVAPLIEDTPYDVCILLAGLFLILNFPRTARPVASCLVAALLGLLSLCKGTQAVLAVATLGAVTLQSLLSRRLARGAVIVGSYLGSYLLLWLLARQSPANLPAFWRGIGELSSGYNNAMGLLESPEMTRLGLVVLALLLAGAALIAGVHRRRPATLLAVAFYAGFVFVEWKHGFVRGDGHVFIFFHFALIGAALPLLLAPPPSRWLRSLSWLLALATLWLAAFVSTRRGEAHGLLVNAPAVFSAKLDQLLHPARAKAVYDAALDRRRQIYALPALSEKIGAGSVDFFGHEHGFIPLNGLRYHPRPAGGGGFNVYTEYLKQLNEDFLLDPARRPDFYLLKTQTLDGRLLTQDDSRALLPLLYLYRPVATERAVELLAPTPHATPPPAPMRVVERIFHWGEPIAVPALPDGSDDLTLVAFNIELTWLGRLRAFFYKPPQVHLQLEGDGLRHPDHLRLVPEMVRSPVILSPAVEDSTDLLELYTDAPGKRVRALTVTSTDPALYRAAHLRVTFFRLPRPPRAPAAAALSALARFPCSNLGATFAAPPAFPHYLDGEYVVGFHAPSRAEFLLDGTERGATMTFGLEPAAYTHRGATNGVTFVLELEQPGLGQRSIFRRHVDPLAQPADRGPLTQHIPFPPWQGPAKLTLRTDPGPNGDAAWDWAYISSFQVAKGAFLLSQFPGFNVAPVAVEGTNSGIIGLDGHDVFLLNAPGRLVFALTGAERHLAFAGGFMPGAYTDGGRTDGALFIAELIAPDGQVTPVLHRLLDPRAQAADRGALPFTADLPAHAAGSRLVVRIDPGPAGDTSWDWTYVADLHIN